MMRRYDAAKANQVNNPSGQQQMPAYKGPTQAQWEQMKNQPATGYAAAPSLGGQAPAGGKGGLPSLTNPGNVPTGINQLLRPPSNAIVGMSRDEMMRRYDAAKANQVNNPSVAYQTPQMPQKIRQFQLPFSSPASVRPTQTGLTSNFYDPSYGIDRGFADQMTARNKAMQGMDSGQIQYDPVNKSFFSVGARGQRGGPALQGTYDQMYHKYDINNQLAALGTSSAGGVGGMPRGGPFNAAQIDFINKNQDVYGPYSSPSDQNGNKLQAMKDAQDAQAASQGGLSQPTQTQSVRPPLGGGYANSGKVNQPMPSTGYPKINEAGFGDARNFNFGATPAPNTQADSLGAVALGQPTQSYPKQSQAPARKPVNRGKLNQLMPTPGV